VCSKTKGCKQPYIFSDGLDRTLVASNSETLQALLKSRGSPSMVLHDHALLQEREQCLLPNPSHFCFPMAVSVLLRVQCLWAGSR
jgi:hypothetical protein